MGKDKGCRGCGDKPKVKVMSRGDFIGTGAVLAAGASIGGAGAVMAQPAGLGSQQVPCPPPPQDSRCGADAMSHPWEIEASILNVLWAEIFPRLVADAWQAGPGPFLMDGSDPQPMEFGKELDPGDTVVGGLTTAIGLRTRISRLVALERADLGLGSGDCPTHFGIRARELLEYLEEPPGNQPDLRMPIRLVAEGEFDFILSDVGLELFAPAKPSAERYLLDFYKFRRTGRGSLGIPNYLDGPNAWAFAIDAPTSAGQVWTNSANFNGMPVGPGQSCPAVNLLDCLDYTEVDTHDVPRNPEQDPDQDPREIEPAVLIGRTNLRGFTLESYACAVGKRRCWQVSGAVYRAILTELPRIIAEIWFERDQGIHNALKSYHTRFQVGNPKARDIFKERVETSLPPAGRMVFETMNPPPPPPPPALPPPEDVKISNQGFRLPAAGPMAPLGNMIQRIAVGAAGNPVFTDSRRPIRGT